MRNRNYIINDDNITTILSCLAENHNSFARVPSILDFLRENRDIFPKEINSFIEKIENDCKRSLYEY